jgi:hypothetical protein
VSVARLHRPQCTIPGEWNKPTGPVFPNGYFTPEENIMKKITVVLAALASFAVAAPTIASAEGMHKGMHRGMHHGMMHRHMHRDMMMHRHHHHGMMHHMMKKEGM